MGNIALNNSISYIKDNYPEVRIRETSSEIIFKGHFIIDARKGNFEIHEAPLLKIVMNKQYPQILPVCYDINGKITYDHVFQDRALCVATTLDIANGLRDSVSIQDYIDKFLIPYFLSYRYWQKTNQDLNGDRAHGRQGIYDSLRDYINESLENDELTYLLCWASKTRKFKRCVPQDLQQIFLQKYLPHMKRLRLLGIPSLRLQYKILIQI